MSNLTNVHLLNVPFEADYKNTLYFGSKDAQTNYFLNRVVHSCTDASYQRKEKAFRINKNVDSLYNCNYVMYQNTAFSDKWFYAFITDLEYRNEETTFVHFEIDVMQTWAFDYTIKPSFIEREHVNDDTIGLHTVPEGLETGEFICNELDRDLELRDYAYILNVTDGRTEDTETTHVSTNMGGVHIPGDVYVSDDFSMIAILVREWNIAGKGDAVANAYMIPKKIINFDFEDHGLLFDGQTAPVTYNHTTSKQKTLDGYTPTNKKLLSYPYNYLLLSNNSGSANILHYEHFSGAECEFEIAGVPCVGGSIKCVPINYKGLNRIQEEGIMCGKFPTLAWSNDNYTNWLTQNAVNNTIGFVSDGLKVVAGTTIAIAGTAGTGGIGAGIAGTGGGAMIVSGVSGIASRLSQMHQMSFTPNSARGNTNGGDINTCYKMNTFYFYKMSIKKEFATVIDGFFNMFGYKVNAVKTPNKNHRKNYWYTKTIDVNIDGAIPNKELQQIKNCYNAGITFWRSGSDVGNYSIDNSIT